MARIPYPDPETLSEKSRELLDRLPAKLNVFRMMAHAETGFRPLVMLGGSILGEQKLDPKLRELVILRVARLSRAEYEWVQHVALARGVGMSDDEIAALERDDARASCFDGRARLVLDFTDDVVTNVRASDALLERCRQEFSDREIVELLLTIGYYMLIARFLETTGVDLEEAAGANLLSRKG